LLHGFRRFWAETDRSKNLAPPACPNAEERAAKIQARDLAVGFINNLLSKLSGLQGNRTAFGPRRVPGEPVDLIYWKAQWDKARTQAQAALARCEAADLQHQVESLDVQWAALVEQETKAAPEVSSGENQNNSGPAPEEIERSKGPGRPSGSGSYERLDFPLVREMRQVLLKHPHLSVTAVANRFVERAAGGGTPESKAKRLTQRYSAQFPEAAGRNQLK
jgi:hypothetical protein